MRYFIPRLLILMMICLCSQAEEIYKTVDENGKVIYTDTPLEQGEKVEMKETNTLPPPPYLPKRASGNEGQEEQLNYVLYIQSPAEGTKVGPEQTSISVEVSLNRGLEDSHFLQLFINGEAHGSPTKASSLVAQNLFRGQRSLVAVVIDDQGNWLASSPPVTVFVIRPNSKAK